MKIGVYNMQWKDFFRNLALFVGFYTIFTHYVGVVDDASDVQVLVQTLLMPFKALAFSFFVLLIFLFESVVVHQKVS